jgi:hypothetical protein
MNKNRFNIEDEAKVLEAVNLIIGGDMSSRKAAEYLSSTTGKTISHEGLRKIVLRHLEKLVKDGRESE